MIDDERDLSEEDYWRHACPDCEGDLRGGTHTTCGTADEVAAAVRRSIWREMSS